MVAPCIMIPTNYAKIGITGAILASFSIYTITQKRVFGRQKNALTIKPGRPRDQKK